MRRRAKQVGPLAQVAVVCVWMLAPVASAGGLTADSAGFFGGPLQFTSHGTIGFAVGQRRAVRIGLRVQHISNASVYENNAGTNPYGITVDVGLRRGEP